MKIDYLNLRDITAMHASEIHEAVHDTIDSGWYLKGNATSRFETAYAEYIGTRHCVACGNGLDALRLMLKAYMLLGRLDEGDEVIVPANTYIATILAITDNKLVPVLVEPDISTLQLDASQIESHLTPRTKAVMLVHLYGRCAMTPLVADICHRHGLLLFEDNAQAHGCRYGDIMTGALGNSAAHSFYPGKNLGALGDAGAVTTDDTEVADIVRALGNYGSSRKYVFDYPGFNSRIDEIQAAVLSIKLKYLDHDNNRRKEIARYYENNINNTYVNIPSSGSDCVFHIFPILSDYRDQLKDHLALQGISTIIHYPIPPHKQECYRHWHTPPLPITEKIHNTELSLPCHQAMSDIEVEYVVKSINSFTI